MRRIARQEPTPIMSPKLVGAPRGYHKPRGPRKIHAAVAATTTHLPPGKKNVCTCNTFDEDTRKGKCPGEAFPLSWMKAEGQVASYPKKNSGFSNAVPPGDPHCKQDGLSWHGVRVEGKFWTIATRRRRRCVSCLDHECCRYKLIHVGGKSWQLFLGDSRCGLPGKDDVDQLVCREYDDNDPVDGLGRDPACSVRACPHLRK